MAIHSDSRGRVVFCDPMLKTRPVLAFSIIAFLILGISAVSIRLGLFKRLGFAKLPKDVTVEERFQTVEFCGVPYVAEKIVRIRQTNVAKGLAKFAAEHPEQFICETIYANNPKRVDGSLNLRVTATDCAEGWPGFLCFSTGPYTFVVDPSSLRVLVPDHDGGKWIGTLSAD